MDKNFHLKREQLILSEKTKKGYFRDSMETLMFVINDNYEDNHFKCDGVPIKINESTLSVLTKE